METGIRGQATPPGIAAEIHKRPEDSDGRRRLSGGRAVFVVLFTLLLIFVGYGLIADELESYMVPAHDKVTMQEQIDALGEYRRIRRLRTQGNTFYLVEHCPSGIGVPSGPAQYLFDEDGTLVGWVWDSGDAPFPELRTLMDKDDLVVDEVTLDAALALQDDARSG